MARNVMRPVTKYAQRATHVLFSGVHVRGSAPTDYSISKSKTMQFVGRAKQCVVTHFTRELITSLSTKPPSHVAASPRGRKYAPSYNNKVALRSRNAEPNVSDNRCVVHINRRDATARRAPSPRHDERFASKLNSDIPCDVLVHLGRHRNIPAICARHRSVVHKHLA